MSAERLGEGFTNGLTGVKTPPRPAEALPKKTYTEFMAVNVSGHAAQLHHPANAHTDGDTYVQFVRRQCAVDRRHGDHRPLSEYRFRQWRQYQRHDPAANTYLSLTNENTKIVPGHGPLANREQLIEYRKMLVTARDRMAKLIKEGKTEQDVLALKPFVDLDAKWAMNDQASQNWIRVVYNSLKK